ncbi:unnamed protein product [Symbiodinium natans]|uniref:Uncharacterized protein n=1 Tax=Symbiodinium natans TaxID=878477 RepID=A0A812K0V3_9DINO|nr:unnamed protein product [Symbiodinium natans]
MKHKRLISCIGYAWRTSRELNVPALSNHLNAALQALRMQCPSACHLHSRSADIRRTISIFDALVPTKDEGVQADAGRSSGDRVMDDVPMAHDVETQTETEIITRAQCEQIMQNLQCQFEAAAEKWRETMLMQDNLITKLQDDVCRLTAEREANVPIQHDVNISTGPGIANEFATASGGMHRANGPAQSSTLQELREQHDAERMRLKQQRREQRSRAWEGESTTRPTKPSMVRSSVD